MVDYHYNTSSLQHLWDFTSQELLVLCLFFGSATWILHFSWIATLGHFFDPECPIDQQPINPFSLKKNQPIGLIKNVPSTHSVVLLANSYQSNFWSFFSQLAQSSNKQRTHGSIVPALGEKQLIIFPSQGQGSRNVRMVVKVEWFL